MYGGCLVTWLYFSPFVMPYVCSFYLVSMWAWTNETQYIYCWCLLLCPSLLLSVPLYMDAFLLGPLSSHLMDSQTPYVDHNGLWWKRNAVFKTLNPLDKKKTKLAINFISFFKKTMIAKGCMDPQVIITCIFTHSRLTCMEGFCSRFQFATLLY